MTRAPGYTLIEVMVAVAIMGILCALGPGIYRTIEAPGRPGNLAHRAETAREVLLEFFEELRLRPYDDFSEEIASGHDPGTIQSRVPFVNLSYSLVRIARGTIRFEVVAHWDDGRGRSAEFDHELRLWGLKGTRGW